jgi:hypothetical protein
MAKRTVVAADGLTWDIYICRVKRSYFPDPRLGETIGQSLYLALPGEDIITAGADAAAGDLIGGLLFSGLGLGLKFLWNAVRSIGSPLRWVEACSYWPREMRMIWQTTRDHADSVRDYLLVELPTAADALPPYGLLPPNARAVSLPRPIH